MALNRPYIHSVEVMHYSAVSRWGRLAEVQNASAIALTLVLVDEGATLQVLTSGVPCAPELGGRVFLAPRKTSGGSQYKSVESDSAITLDSLCSNNVLGLLRTSIICDSVTVAYPSPVLIPRVLDKRLLKSLRVGRIESLRFLTRSNCHE